MERSELTFKALHERFDRNREAQFWGFQALGWGGLCVVTFLSLTVWYGAPNWSHVSHTIVQALMGIGLSLVLRALFRKIWNMTLLVQFLIVITSVTLISALWTALRMQAFLWLGQEYDIWKDFGGWYFGSFMVFLSWSAFYYGIKFYGLLQDEQRQSQQAHLQVQAEQLKRLSAEAGARNAQIEMLRYQLNPHFLFNTLNSISALVKTDRTKQARTMLTQLSDFLRFSLDSDASQKVTLEQEIEALQLYLNIEKVRYGERLKMEFDFGQEASRGVIPSLILQPLLENALKYAVAGRVNGGIIRVSGRVQDNDLILTVEDSGLGAGHKNTELVLEPNFKKGIGLNNIVSRLASEYEEKAEMTFHRADIGGLRVVIRLPHETEISSTPGEPRSMTETILT